MFTTIDWVVVVVIVAFMAFVVRKFSARMKSAEDYYLAARSIPFSLLVGTLVATWYGGQGCLNSVEAGAVSGMASWGIWCVGAHLSRIPLALYLAPEVSVRTEVTIPQMVKKAYGPRIAFFIAAYMLVNFLSMGEIVAMRNVFAGLFGSDQARIMVIVVLLIVIVITNFAGLMGVAVVDMMLFWCMCTAIALAVPAMWGQAGGWAGLAESLTQQMGAVKAEQMFNPIFGGNTLGVITLLIMSLGIYVNASLYQRFSAADTPRNASRSYLTAFCIFIMLDFLLTVSGLLVQAIQPGGNVAQTYVNLVCTNLPLGVRAIFLVGVLGAIISTLDGCWLVAGMTVSNDIIGTFKKLTDKENILYSRVTVIVIAILAYMGATFFTESLKVTTLFGTMTMSLTFVVNLAGVFYKGKKSEFGAWATIVVGGVIYFFLTFVHPMGFNGMLVALPAAIATFFLTKGIGKDPGESLAQH